MSGRAKVAVLDLASRDFVPLLEGCPAVQVDVDGLRFTISRAGPGPGAWKVSVTPVNGEAIEVRADEVNLTKIQASLSLTAMRDFDHRGVGCHAGADGDCGWAECPQLRAGEPAATGRHCPLDATDPDL